MIVRVHYAFIIKVGGANTESKNSRDSSICLKNNLNHSISSGTILKQGFNGKIPNLSFKCLAQGHIGVSQWIQTRVSHTSLDTINQTLLNIG